MDIKEFNFESKNEQLHISNGEVESNYKLESLLDEIDEDISFGNFSGDDIVSGAREKLKRIVDEYPKEIWGQNERFYWAKVRIDHKIKNDAAFAEHFNDISDNPSYNRAKQIAKSSNVKLYDELTRLEAFVIEYNKQIEQLQKNKIEEDIARDFAIDSYGTLVLYLGVGGDVALPEKITSIGKGAFMNCTNLKSVTILSNTNVIHQWAFFKCTNLTTVKIPNTVIAIGKEAFYGCTNLTSVTISKECNIGVDAFPKNCKVIKQ